MSEFDLPALEAGFERALERTLASTAPRVLLCRHSIRGPIPVDPDLRDVPLLDAGEGLCRALGARHGWVFASAWSSPMRRCRDSLGAFGEGAGVEPSFVADTRLGAPGAFIADPSGAWESYVRLRKHELVRCLHADPEEVQGYRSLEAGVGELLSLFEGLPGDAPAIACSHDILMSSLLSWAFDRPWLRPQWPDFFEGIVLEFDEAEGQRTVRVSYRDEVVQRRVPLRPTS